MDTDKIWTTLLCTRTSLLYKSLAVIVFLAAMRAASGQTIQPVIQEYISKADGKFELTNDTPTPMAVVLEPKSFSISVEGRGLFRQLDPSIHLKLSATSIRLEPKQTYMVFYKADAASLPAWFSIYAVFSPLKAAEGVKLRVMLPHTVYLYQKKPLERDNIHIAAAAYDADKRTVNCDLSNDGMALVRVQEVRAVAGKTTVTAAGFPLLPGSSRHVSVEWNGERYPEYLLLHFPRFDVKQSLVPKAPTP